MRGSKATTVPFAPSRDAAPAMSATLQRASARTRARHPRAPMAWVPLMRQSPSFAARVRGSRPAARRAGPLGWRAPPTNTSPSPIIARAMWARGARSPEAPTLPLAGHHRQDVLRQHGQHEVDDLRPHPRVARGHDVGSEQHQGPGLGQREGGPDPHRVAPDQVHLELREILGGDPGPGQEPEAGVDPIDRGAGRRLGLHQGPGRRDAGPGRGAQGHPGPAVGHRGHVIDGEGAAVPVRPRGGRSRPPA
jgi:hypothetical protein